MSLEGKIHDKLLNHPKAKKVVKRCYQRTMVLLSKKFKNDGNIVKVSPDDGYDYFFGYYDKSPWDITGRYMLCMKAQGTSKNVAPNEKVEILLIDTQNDNATIKIAESNSWNVQQGCMAQWLGPKYDEKIIYNDFRDGNYCSIIFNVFSGKEKVINMPIYSVSSDGKFALSLNFSRLHRLRPGYGYSNLEDQTKDEKIPDSPCVWKIDLEENKVESYLSYKDFYNFETREEMVNAEHKVNHIMISPDNDKFMIIHRWFVGNKKYSRLLTCDIRTKKLFNLSDDNMVSHCYWKNNDEIIAFENKKGEGNGYYLMKDKSKEFTHLWPSIKNDGHPSYSPNGNLVVTDSYPNKKRISTIRIMNEITSAIVAKVYNPFKYDNDTRCDLHPRWNREGNKICFDGCFEGKRGLYVINLDKTKITEKSKLGKVVNNVKGKYKVLFILNTCRKSGPTQVVFNIIKKLDFHKFEPVILTLDPENNETVIGEIYPYISNHFFAPIKKMDIIRGKLSNLEKIIDEINPDIIHTTGVFPDYAVAKLKKYKQVVTMHNYVYEDYISKFGKMKGNLLAKMQLYAAKHSTKTVTCSKSLADIYNKELRLSFDFIQNGIDVFKYKKVNNKKSLRKELDINLNSFIFIYTGQFIKRKNIDFLLDAFTKTYANDLSTNMILLGNGAELPILKEKYSMFNNIKFLGIVSDVEKYLSGADAYVSASKSEGLPNGVLEAMACELPVLLSDIPQHLEVLETGGLAGYSFSNNDVLSLTDAMKKIRDEKNLESIGLNAKKVVVENFSDFVMSEKYQKLYSLIIEDGVKDEQK